MIPTKKGSLIDIYNTKMSFDSNAKPKQRSTNYGAPLFCARGICDTIVVLEVHIL